MALHRTPWETKETRRYLAHPPSGRAFTVEPSRERVQRELQDAYSGCGSCLVRWLRNAIKGPECLFDELHCVH